MTSRAQNATQLQPRFNEAAFHGQPASQPAICTCRPSDFMPPRRCVARPNLRGLGPTIISLGQLNLAASKGDQLSAFRRPNVRQREHLPVNGPLEHSANEASASDPTNAI